MENIKEEFELLKNSNISYLDNAATTQKPKVVIDRIKKFYETENANPNRGAYALSVLSTEIVESSRDKVAKFINANNSNEIIFTKNATESLNLIAYSYGLNNLKEGDEVVVSIMEHHSNLVLWQMVCKKNNCKLKYMYINENFEIDEKEIEEKITSKTKLVAITHVSNVTGTINDIQKIINCAHKKGAVVVVDASQSIPHMKIDVKKLDADFLVFSGHKMMASLGIGVLYGKEKLLESMPPFMMGGGMIEFVNEKDATFATLPKKFEAGTLNVEGILSLKCAIEYIESIGYEKIHKLTQDCVNYGVERLKKLRYISLYIPNNLSNHSSVISFNLNGIHPHDVASILDKEGVCIRSGNHCAQPLMRYLNIDSTCRASIYFYNTKEDIDKLIMAIEKTYAMFKKYIEK